MAANNTTEARHASPKSRVRRLSTGTVVVYADPAARGGLGDRAGAVRVDLAAPAAAGGAVARLAGVTGPRGEELAGVVGVGPDGLQLGNGRVLPADRLPALIRGLLPKNAGKDRRRNAEVLVRLVEGTLRTAGAA